MHAASLICLSVTLFVGANADGLLSFVPQRFQNSLRPELKSLLAETDVNGVIALAGALRHAPEYKNYNEFLAHLQKHNPRMARVVDIRVQTIREHFNQTGGEMSEKSHEFLNGVRDHAKEFGRSLFTLLSKQDDETHANLKKVFPLLTSVVTSPAMISFEENVLFKGEKAPYQPAKWESNLPETLDAKKVEGAADAQTTAPEHTEEHKEEEKKPTPP